MCCGVEGKLMAKLTAYFQKHYLVLRDLLTGEV